MALDSEQQLDQQLLDAMQRFGVDFDHAKIEAFKPALGNWGHSWKPVGSNRLAAADYLAAAAGLGCSETRALLDLFISQRQRLLWEQSYSKADKFVSEKMLESYGFVETIGLRGPFVSDKIRCGIGVWGPQVVYPKHRHAAEEIYILLAGSARFTIAGKTSEAQAGDLLAVPSQSEHGFRTSAEPLVVYYLWQAGDLRETSTFVQDENS